MINTDRISDKEDLELLEALQSLKKALEEGCERTEEQMKLDLEIAELVNQYFWNLI